MRDIKLSVVCLAFNHFHYIRQALDGFVMQKTNFSFEVIVHDDASTDGTAEIIREYEKKYPDIIKPVYQKENTWNKGIHSGKNYVYPKIKGKYVALCEGDDYWTDEYKLQKQVDYLDAHPDCSLCFHPVKVVWDDKRADDSVFPDDKMLTDIKTLNYDSLLKRNFIQTNSVVYRWRFHNDSYDLIPDKILPGDWFLHLLHAQIGKIGFLPDAMAVYRRNIGGIWTGAGKTPEWFCCCGLANIKFYQEKEKQFKSSEKYSIEFTRYATYYAGLLLNNHYILSCFTDISIPSKNKMFNYLQLVKFKFMYKIMWGSYAKLYKARYKSLKLYLSWRNKP